MCVFSFILFQHKKTHMKKQLSILALLCAIGFGASAQTEKGKSLIGGTLLFNSNKSETEMNVSSTKNSSFEAAPSYGYFVANNLAIGISASFSHSKSENSYQSTFAVNGVYSYSQLSATSTTNRYLIGPFVRYYVPISDQFKFFGQFNAGIGFGDSEIAGSSYISNKSKLSSLQAALSPGLAFFPARKWAIEFGFNLLSFARDKDKENTTLQNDSTVDTFVLGLSTFTPRIGVNFHF